MSNFIPKISFGSGPTIITFDLPPEGDNIRERTKANIRRTISSNGTAQHQFNYNEKNFNPRFVWLTETLITALRSFHEDHALQGKPFDYFEHSDEAGFDTVTLSRFEFRPTRVIPDGAGDFLYDLQMSFRKTL